jgi:hypothetical protein
MKQILRFRNHSSPGPLAGAEKRWKALEIHIPKAWAMKQKHKFGKCSAGPCWGCKSLRKSMQQTHGLGYCPFLTSKGFGKSML